MRVRLTVAAIIIAAFMVGLCTSTYGTPGRTANGGIVVQTPWFNGGLEVWGHPGLFSCYSRVVDGVTVEYGC